MRYKIDVELTLQFFQIMASRNVDCLHEFMDNIVARDLYIISVTDGTVMSNKQEHEFNERLNGDNTNFFHNPRFDFFVEPDHQVWIGWAGDRVVELIESKPVLAAVEPGGTTQLVEKAQ
jgi:hypothetical protein